MFINIPKQTEKSQSLLTGLLALKQPEVFLVASEICHSWIVGLSAIHFKAKPVAI